MMTADNGAVAPSAAAAGLRQIDTPSLQRQLDALRQLDTERQQLDGELVPALTCAATLTEFDPAELLAAFGLSPDSERLARLFEHASAVHSKAALTLEINPLPAGPWRLQLSQRQRLLRGAGTAQALRLARRALPGPDQLSQRMADALLFAELPALNQLSLGELAALMEVRGWYEGVIEPLPDEPTLRARLALSQLLDPMRRLVGQHFVGRTRELSQLADYVSLLGPQAFANSELLGSAVRYLRRARRSLIDNPPLFVAGPGGVGKSSLLARFILNHMDSPQGADLPFVMLDFDRAQVESKLPLTLLVAALQQLRVQFSAHADAMSRMADHLTQVMRSSDATELSKADSLQGSVVEDFARKIDLMLGGEDSPTRLLWVLDTFEEPQRLGESTVGPLWELMDTLQRHLPRLRLVVCGRVVPPGFAWDVIALDEFDDASALAYLRSRLVAAGVAAKANPTTLGQVIKVVGRTPLALRLAARLLAEDDSQLLNLKLKRERIQAVLFHRVLEHIRVHDPLESRSGRTAVSSSERRLLEEELGRLVYPGLAVRRITAGVIEHVLAKPCNVKLRDAGHAQRLFDALAQQVDIVEPGDADGAEPCLLHRTDVRRMVLRDLELKAGEALIACIDRRAVAYHASAATLPRCAEEIYHRLRLQQSDATIRARWEPGLKPYLMSALEELAAPDMRLLLADLLEVTLDSAALEGAEQNGWERQAARRAEQYLRSGSPERALSVLNERADRVPTSPLLRLQAQALQLMGRFADAAAVASQALQEAADNGDLASACDAALQLALAEEGAGSLHAAAQQYQRAHDWAIELGHDLFLLSALAGLMRLDRRLDAPPAQIDERAAHARALLSTETLRQLRRRPALLRELLAELGARDLRLLRLGLSFLGVDLPSPAEAGQLAQTLVAWSAGAELPELVHELAVAHGVTANAFQPLPTQRQWQDWLWGRAPTEIAGLLLQMLKDIPPSNALLARVALVFRHDVQRRIERGARQRVV